jgi:hypothetical protein
VLLVVCAGARAAAAHDDAAAGGQHVHQPPATSAPPEHHHQTSDHAGHQMGPMLFSPREASGTSWLPDVTPMYGIAQQAGRWELMWHGNAFGQLLYESGDRGDTQAGSINWIMGMARRELAGGQFGVRGMLSLEPATIGGCGYPNLLASGETCKGEPIHDRQHPHDLFMEAAVDYERRINGTLRWQAYAGLAGEPALGPVAFPHRLSAMPNPLAPISHHWLDATHITFGVVTAGIYDRKWKAEGSVFNGREPDEHRWDLDLAALDSVSGRFWFMPTSTIALQVSAGHLADAEAGHDGSARVDVDRVTASATFHRPIGTTNLLATTAAWGMNRAEGESSHAFLLESSLTRNERHTWFGRFEVVGKAAHDLDIHDADELFTVAKLQGGYTRYFGPWHKLQPGVGGSLSLGFVPQSLEPYYGARVNPGLAIFVTLRPAAHGM